MIYLNWRPLSRSELTPIIFNMELTHFDSEAFSYITNKIKFYIKAALIQKIYKFDIKFRIIIFLTPLLYN